MKGFSTFSSVLLTTTALTVSSLAQAQISSTTGPPQGVEASSALTDIVVTARRNAEPLQTVPIAVTAFTGDQLEARQLRNVTDLQFQAPNVTFTQGETGGTDLQIRGVGTLLVNGESGVGIHYNDVFIAQPRLTETEYYDLADIELLRGPQGTLFGRNSTGGVLNIKTQPAILNKFEVLGEGEIGNYDDRKVRGAVNIPIVDDKLAVRIAGLYLDRSGYTENINTGNAIDGRKQYSVRASVLAKPFEGTTLTVVGSYFDEDSSRLRFQKQLCVRDPSGVLGCLPSGVATDPVNSNTTGVGFTSNFFLGKALGRPDLGLTDFFNPPISANPSSYRQVNQAFDPSYKSHETFVTAELKQELTDHLDFTLLGGFQENGVRTTIDFQSAVYGNFQLPAAFFTYKPAAAAFLGLKPGSSMPTSDLGPCGIVCGGVQKTNGLGLEDLTINGGHQYSLEGRLSSHFDGRFNFQVAGYYLYNRYFASQEVIEPFLDYAAIILAGPDPSPNIFTSLLPTRFQSSLPTERLESYAFFGEAYYQIIPDKLKLTVGLRRTTDDKIQVSRQALFSIPVQTNVATGLTSYIAPNGTVTTSGSDAVLLNAAAAAGAADFDPSTPGSQAYAYQHLRATAYTGRAVIDYTPHLSFTDQTLIYASYSRGAKPGGFNPPTDPALMLGTPPTYGSETINAFEIGTKNLLLGRRLRLNATAFYYDYKGLQIGTITNRTSLTTNVDTKIYGAELETSYSPTRALQFDGSVSYLHTRLGDSSSIDPRDPSQSRTDADLVKDLFSNGNCVVLDNGNPSIENNPALLQTLNSNGGFYVPTGPAGVPYLPAGAPAGGIPKTPGFAHTAFGSCGALAASKALTGAGYQFFQSGLPVSLQGKQLPNAPQWSIALGAQYTFTLPRDIKLVTRVDYTWRDKFFGSQYNTPRDRINGYDQVNLSATVSGPHDRWYVRGFVQNLTDRTNIIGEYNSDPSSGLYTNAFLSAPRLYGQAIGGKY